MIFGAGICICGERGGSRGIGSGQIGGARCLGFWLVMVVAGAGAGWDGDAAVCAV